MEPSPLRTIDYPKEGVKLAQVGPTAHLEWRRISCVVQAWSLHLRIPCWVESAALHVESDDTNGDAVHSLTNPDADADADADSDTASVVAATPCSLFSVPGLQPSAASFAATLVFEHSIQIVRGKWTKSPSGGQVRVGQTRRRACHSVHSAL